MSTRRKGRDFLLGVTAILLALALLVVAYLAYDRALVPSEEVTLRTDVVGNQLQTGSDVKLNGVPIGHVSEIQATEDGSELSLALDPDSLRLLPDNVVARLLPKTLFGERYVALVDPASPSGETLEAGAVIQQDPSAEAAELQQVLDDLLPVLRAIQPDKLSAMMGELAMMLRDNGDDLGRTMVDWQRYVERLNPLVPQMTEDFARLSRVAEHWSVAAPDLIDALATMTTSSQTLVDNQDTLRDVYANVIGMADTTGGWVDRNHNTIVVLSKESRAALRATAPYASQFPCLFEAVSDYRPKMEAALGKDTDEPGIHAVLEVVPVRKKYLAGKDALRYTKGTPEPRCPYVTGNRPGTQPARADGTGDPPAMAPPRGTTVESHLLALTGLGDANSPGENQLIAELVAPTRGMAPSDYPAWSSLLLGPTLRNTKVVLK